jgi:DNA polymerase-4
MNWMLTDMDSYFASVEQYLRPELRGRPVGIIPVETDSTCVIAASRDAKLLGVKVGTGVREARRLCPGIALVKARPKIYVQVHHRLLRNVDQCAEVHRVYSIDEWTVQLRGGQRNPEQARKLAQSMKRRMLEEFGPWMTCSIGIAPTRLLAKIASELEKPDGLTALSVEEMPARVEHLSLTDLCGISNGMLARLKRHGIENIRALWDINRNEAIRIWGSVSGAYWWAGFHGHDEPELPTRRRSMTHGNVLAPRFRNEEGACGIMVRLVCKLAHRLRQGGYLAEFAHLH